MTELEKLVKESTSLVQAVEGISLEIPKIKELFSECRKMKTDFSALTKKNENALQKRFEENISRLDTAVGKMNRSIEHWEEIYRSFGDIEKLTQLFHSYEERLSDMEERIDIMTKCLVPELDSKGDTLLNVIKANQFKLPMRVKHGSWKDFEFEILDISDRRAIGNVYNESGKKKEIRKYSLNHKGFFLCSDSENTPQKKEPGSPALTLDEELPFS